MNTPDQPALSTTPALAVVIVNYRTADLTIECVASLAPERETAGPFEVIIVDGASGDGSAEKLAAHFADTDWVSILPLDFNGGFGWANNQAMLRLLQRPNPPAYIHVLNPDAAVQPGAVRALLDRLESDARIGAAGSQLVEPNGMLAGSAFRFPSPGQELLRGIRIGGVGRRLGLGDTVYSPTESCPVEWVTGASVMFRSEALRQTGLFDDGFFLYFEEVELMRRLSRAGWALWTVLESKVMHIGGAATGVDSNLATRARPLPAYRYASRRRYFMRTGGFAALWAANLAWLAGKLIGVPLGLITGRRAPGVPREIRMTLRHCSVPSALDRRASIPRWDEPPGRMPAWAQK